MENQTNKQGVIGVIYRGGKILPVSVVDIKQKPTGETIFDYKFIRNPYYQYSELRLIVPELVNGEPTGETIEEVFYPESADLDKLFAVLENDVDLTPDLVGIDSDLERLEVILDAIFHDIIISKKKIYFVFPQDPDAEDWAKVGQLWAKDIMGYIALPKSAKPDGKQGLTGIDPNSIQLQVYQPENKGRNLWIDYRNWMREILWKFGIRFDTLEDKKERASVNEVQQSSSYFDDIENERRQCRVNFIDWCIRNWGKQALNIDYTFSYGKKPDQ